MWNAGDVPAQMSRSSALAASRDSSESCPNWLRPDHHLWKRDSRSPTATGWSSPNQSWLPDIIERYHLTPLPGPG